MRKFMVGDIVQFELSCCWINCPRWYFGLDSGGTGELESGLVVSCDDSYFELEMFNNKKTTWTCPQPSVKYFERFNNSPGYFVWTGNIDCDCGAKIAKTTHSAYCISNKKKDPN